MMHISFLLIFELPLETLFGERHDENSENLEEQIPSVRCHAIAQRFYGTGLSGCRRSQSFPVLPAQQGLPNGVGSYGGLFDVPL